MFTCIAESRVGQINVPKRLRASNLWKEFVNIPTGIVKRVPSWVDWPFVIRGALRRLFGTPLFIEPLSDEDALIADLALDTMSVEFANPKELFAKRKVQREAAKAAALAPASSAERANEPSPFPVLESSPEPPAKPAPSPTKKRKAVEKGNRKIPAKKSKKSEVTTPDADVEPHTYHGGDPQVEVDLPPRVSLLQDKNTNVGIMRQLLSEVDNEILNEGPVQNHLDDLLWDGLKINVRAMGLFYRTTDKVVEQKARIKELENKDKGRDEKLLDIERKFGDVRTSAEELTGELKTVMQSSKEMTDMMKVMVDRYNEAQAKIKGLEADNSSLVARIVDAYEKATIKVIYDLLKEYKQGLLVDADVDDEIELFEEIVDEAGCSSSVPADGAVPASNKREPTGIEPPININPSKDREMREEREL